MPKTGTPAESTSPTRKGKFAAMSTAEAARPIRPSTGAITVFQTRLSFFVRAK